MKQHWIDRYIKLAKEVASWSKDPSTKVGAFIVDSQNRTVSSGFNGAAPEFDDEWVLDSRTRKLLYTDHAEHNAIKFADKKRLVGSSIFVTQPPCNTCAEKIIDAGIKYVYYLPGDEEFRRRWNSQDAIDTLRSKGVECHEC